MHNLPPMKARIAPGVGDPVDMLTATPVERSGRLAALFTLTVTVDDRA